MNFLPKNVEITVKIAKNLAQNTNNLLKEIGFITEKTLFISDEKIVANCKQFYEKPFESTFGKVLILQDPKPDEENLTKIIDAAKNYDFVVGLGSGVINNFCFSTFDEWLFVKKRISDY